MHQKLNLSAAERTPALLWPGAVILMLAALILGGATREGDLLHAAIRLASLPVLLAALSALSAGRAARLRWPLLLLAAAIATPLVQLIPLPPQVWEALPGRAQFAAAYIAAGMLAPWLPISLDPDGAWNAFLSLLPPAAMFVAVLSLDAGQRWRLLPWVLAVVGLSILLGAAQMLGGETSALRFYEITNASAAVGFFSNRNHQAGLLVAALPLAAAWTLAWRMRGGRRAAPAIAAGAGLVLVTAAGVAASQSRAGLLLLVPALAGAALLTVRALGVKIGARRVAAAAALAVLVVGPLAGFVLMRLQPDLLATLAADPRMTAAPIVAREAVANLPFGTGLGSFEAIYQGLETPRTLTNAFLNHTHDDYLELFLETGVLGPVLIGLFLVWFGRAAVAAWRLDSRSPTGLLAQAASVSAFILLAHSLVDYPLRTAAMATLFAFLCGCLTPPVSRRREIAAVRVK